MKTKITVLGLFCLAAAVFAAGKPEKIPEKVKKAIEKKISEKKAAEKKAEPVKERDPFLNSFYNDSDPSIPLDKNHLPKGISVGGIIIPESGKAIAIISIPGYKKSFFVREKSIVRLDGRELTGKAKRVKKKSRLSDDIYLEIIEITASEVRLVQKQRPDQIYSIR